jgi:hypothetical protein
MMLAASSPPVEELGRRLPRVLGVEPLVLLDRHSGQLASLLGHPRA